MASMSDSKRTEQVQKALTDMMKGCRANGDQNYTHNAQVAPKGKFFVTNQQVHPMYASLCELVSLGGLCGLMEKDDDRMPVIADNDFDFPSNEKTPENPPNVYEPFVVMEEIKAYQEALKQYFQIKNPRSLICCVLEKEHGYMKRGLVHNGFHLHFPFANTDANDQQNTIYPFVKRTMEQRGVLEKMAHQDVKPEKWGKILDPGLPKKTWIMYGCRKDSTSLPYKVTAIYDHELKPLTVKETFDPRELTYVKNNMLPLSFFEGHPPEYYLPIFLSVRAWDAFIPLKDEIKALLPSELARGKRAVRAKVVVASQPNGAPISVNTNAERAAQMKDIRVLVEMLSSQRADGYDTWMHVLWCLYNISHGSTEGLALAIDFSKKSAKFEEGKVDELWEQMTVGNYTIGSLRMWAQQDNPEAYKKWAATEHTILMNKALSLTNFSVANFIFHMYQDKFVCASLKHKTWYEFKKHRWCITDKGAGLYRTFSTEVCKRLDSHRTEISRSMETLAREDEQYSILNERITKIGKLTGKLEDTAFKNKLMSELEVLFYDCTFMTRMDDDNDLLVCNNGVLDFKLGMLKHDRLPVLRPGVPQDYCTKTTGIDFPVNYTYETPEVKEVLDFLHKVLGSKECQEYFLCFAASVLRGGNPNKTLPQWVGPGGNNGKSATTQFFVDSLGLYCIKFPPSYFTGKAEQAGACTPADTRAQGGRIGFIQEPGPGEKLNTVKLKERTGGDSYYVRGLYKEGHDIKNCLKYVIVANRAIPIPSNDTATQGRIKVVPFLTTFCIDSRDVPDTIEEQFAKGLFKADPFFNDKIPRLAPAFLWLAWQYYPKLLANGGVMPYCKEVATVTADYLEDVDTFRSFLKEKVEAKPGNKLKIVKAYKAFTMWWKTNYPSVMIPDRIEMRESLNRIFKKPLQVEEWLDIDIKAEEGELGGVVL